MTISPSSNSFTCWKTSVCPLVFPCLPSQVAVCHEDVISWHRGYDDFSVSLSAGTQASVILPGWLWLLLTTQWVTVTLFQQLYVYWLSVTTASGFWYVMRCLNKPYTCGMVLLLFFFALPHTFIGSEVPCWIQYNNNRKLYFSDINLLCHDRSNIQYDSLHSHSISYLRSYCHLLLFVCKYMCKLIIQHFSW